MTGQACQSSSVSIVTRALPSLYRRAPRATQGAVFNLYRDGAGDIAPLIFERQVETIQAQVDDALAKGATCLLGGEPVQAGGIWYPQRFSPTSTTIC
ncbi:MAG: hypothetical protein CM15mP74_30220 [Halieaceae bacterium]|nr:MAG: hypothetical protein CM15mP74_30220 [Halieaceae bacterium]